MYTDSEVNSILYQAWDEIGDIALEIAERREVGKECSALIDKGYDIRVLIQGYEYGIDYLEDYKLEAILKCLIALADINDYPAANLLNRTVNLNINDGIPGPQGKTGPAGEQGIQGEKGDTGDTGDIGPQGIQGEKGDTGDTGATGQGIQGEKGDTGDAGAKGDTGDTGSQGIQGQAGDKYKTSSVTGVTIPTTHPTQVTLTVGTGLAYTTGQEAVNVYDTSNAFTGTVESYNANTGELIEQSTSNTGTGTYSDWQINLGGSAGVQGKQLIHTESDIILDDTQVSTVEGGSWSPVSPYNASVRVDSRSSQSSPSGITGQMEDHSISYDGDDWYDNGVWRGPQGVKGDKGDDGSTGSQGPVGPQGIKGDDGDTGGQGIKGDQGIQGEKGDTGEKGDKGDDGGTGSQGPTGPQGEKGDTGDTGEKGDKGDTGTTAIGGKWVDLFNVDTEPAEGSWTVTARYTLPDATLRKLRFLISVSLYASTISEYNIRLMGSDTSSSSKTELRRWRVTSDMSGSLESAIPFSMQWAGEYSHGYFRVEIQKNGGGGQHRDTVLVIEELENLSL